MRPHQRILAWLLLALVAAAPAVAQNAQARRTKPLVETLEAQGMRRLRDEEIITHIKTRAGEVYSERQVQLDLQALMALGWFDARQSRVLVETGVRGGTVVIFELVELPLINAVTFSGFDGIKASELRALLRARQIKISEGVVYDPAKARAARHVLQELLDARGVRKRVTVSLRHETDATHVAVEFVAGDER